MKLNRRDVLIAGAVLAAPATLRAQDFPTRPIRIIVPFPAGGTTDLLARLFAQRMTETMGQSVVVENRGGGGGSIGADVVARAAPDGYTLLMHNITFPTTTAAMTLAGRPPHDIERDFAPLSLGANVPLVILANPTVPVLICGALSPGPRRKHRRPFMAQPGLVPS
jgi:tripartite-type tricarboxylate transporter receptor subunit TctC